MKRILALLFILATLPAFAQSEGENISFDGSHQKDFGGFILDMGTMLNAESLVVTPLLPSLSYLPSIEGLSPHQVNPDAFRLNSNITYMGGSNITHTRSSIMSLLYGGIGSGMVNWQGASYKLNNGMRINLFGEYDADGRKVYNPAAMPWQRNNFNAAFEMKSANGNFGIKVEVHGGRY